MLPLLQELLTVKFCCAAFSRGLGAHRWVTTPFWSPGIALMVPCSCEKGWAVVCAWSCRWQETRKLSLFSVHCWQGPGGAAAAAMWLPEPCLQAPLTCLWCFHRQVLWGFFDLMVGINYLIICFPNLNQIKILQLGTRLELAYAIV